MLNAKALSALLSNNSDSRLCKRWFLMTPNGTLLAYSQPCDIRQLRRQAALTALAWQNQEAPRAQRPDWHASNADGDDEAPSRPETHSPATSATPQSLTTLILETDTSNTIMRRIAQQLILVLEGGVPPRKRSIGTRLRAEGPEGEIYAATGFAPGSLATDPGMSASISTLGGDSIRNHSTRSVLAVQRAKLEAMAGAITAEFSRTGFRMPEDSGVRLF